MTRNPPPNLVIHANECEKCKHNWLDLPGYWATHFNGCPNCGWVYWTSKPQEK